MVALDIKTGALLWDHALKGGAEDSYLRGGPMVVVHGKVIAGTTCQVTAGGLVFDGSRDRIFRASDDMTGKVLWETRLPAVPSASPIVYSAKGEQYIAVVAGGGGSHEATWSSLTPEIDNPSGSTSLHVFKLPTAADAVSP